MKAGFLEIPFNLEKSSETVFTLMGKYRDLPMPLADASLVAMSRAPMPDLHRNLNPPSLLFSITITTPMLNRLLFIFVVIFVVIPILLSRFLKKIG